MSPKTGFILMEKVVPRLRAAIPANVLPVGTEDREELIQEGITLAAQLMHSLEEKGKTVTPGNIAYYTLLHLKSGRRSQYGGRADVMGSGTRLDQRSCVFSLEEPAGIDPETGEEIPLGEMLTNSQDDPSESASRNVDWEDFLGSHDGRYGSLLRELAQGKTVRDVAKTTGVKYGRVRLLKEKLARELRDFMGGEFFPGRRPVWRGNVLVDHERATCRAERRRDFQAESISEISTCHG
jgi:hypothetical protein